MIFLPRFHCVAWRCSLLQSSFTLPTHVCIFLTFFAEDTKSSLIAAKPSLALRVSIYYLITQSFYVVLWYVVDSPGKYSRQLTFGPPIGLLDFPSCSRSF